MRPIRIALRCRVVRAQDIPNLLVCLQKFTQPAPPTLLDESKVIPSLVSKRMGQLEPEETVCLQGKTTGSTPHCWEVTLLGK